jgi:hypothetical protein
MVMIKSFVDKTRDVGVTGVGEELFDEDEVLLMILKRFI